MIGVVMSRVLRLYRKAQESQREMKLLLDMYRSAPKEQRDKVQLMAAEKKSKSEVTIPAQPLAGSGNRVEVLCATFVGHSSRRSCVRD